MDIVSLITSIVYLVIFILSFKSFIIKKSLDFHISLNMSYAFLIWTVIAFIKVFNISQETRNILFSFDVYAMFLIFNSAAKIKSAINKKPNLIFRKITNIVFLTSLSISITTISYSFLHNNYNLIILNECIINLIFYILMIIHISNCFECKLIKISMLLFSVKYIVKLFGIYMFVPHYFISIGSYLNDISFVIVLFALQRLYRESIKKELKKQLN